MHKYLHLMRIAYYAGAQKKDRTGTGTRSIFGHQMRFDLRESFPIVTTKKIHFKSVVAELLWFLSGSTNVRDLQAMGCRIWDEWADETGALGPIYGAQWRSWGGKRGIDQIKKLVQSIQNFPEDRGHIVSAWNVEELPHMALRPCHAMFQCDVTDGRLSLQLYQRSADIFLGVPFNISSYSLLAHILAQQCDLEVGEFVWTGGDCHLYENHLEQAQEQMYREPMQLPKLLIKRKPKSIFDYKPEDFELISYEHHPHIAAPVAV